VNSVEKAMATQLANIEIRSGKSLAELARIIAACGLTNHGEIRDMLKRDLKMGHGDANTLVHYVCSGADSTTGTQESKSDEAVLDGIYVGPKAALRSIHARRMAAIAEFGEFEIAPKKAYVSLRRKKQFATIGPATNTRVEVGLNMKGMPPTARLLAMPEKGMCQYKVKVSEPTEVDAELIGWIKIAYDAAG
jgi:hypothetical protein